MDRSTLRNLEAPIVSITGTVDLPATAVRTCQFQRVPDVLIGLDARSATAATPVRYDTTSEPARRRLGQRRAQQRTRTPGLAISTFSERALRSRSIHERAI